MDSRTPRPHYRRRKPGVTVDGVERWRAGEKAYFPCPRVYSAIAEISFAGLHGLAVRTADFDEPPSKFQPAPVRTRVRPLFAGCVCGSGHFTLTVGGEGYDILFASGYSQFDSRLLVAEPLNII